MKENEAIQTLDKARLEEFKNKYGKDKLSILLLPKNDEETEFLEVLVLVPSRSQMNSYNKLVDLDPDTAQNNLLAHCVLTSQEDIIKDDHLASTACSGLVQLFPIRRVRIKKL